SFEQDFKAPADGFPVKFMPVHVEPSLQNMQPLPFRLLRDLAFEARRRRSGPRAIFKREGLGEAGASGQRERLLEVRVGLAGEAHDDVMRKGNVRADLRHLGGQILAFGSGMLAVLWL